VSLDKTRLVAVLTNAETRFYNCKMMKNGMLQGKWTLMQCMVVSLLLFTAGTAGAEETEQSIARTSRAISVAAYAINNNSHSPKSAVPDLRLAVVHNAAARIALNKNQTKAAMFLTLLSRKMAKAVIVLSGATASSQDADEAEIAASIGGEGKDAAAALVEGDKKVPPLPKFKDQIPYDVDSER
jgi:hypothetical protein